MAERKGKPIGSPLPDLGGNEPSRPPQGGKEPGKGKPVDKPEEDYRLGAHRCMQCGAGFADRAALEAHRERGHGLEQ